MEYPVQPEEYVGVMDEMVCQLINWFQGCDFLDTIYAIEYIRNINQVKNKFIKSFSASIIKIVNIVFTFLYEAKLNSDEILFIENNPTEAIEILNTLETTNKLVQSRLNFISLLLYVFTDLRQDMILISTNFNIIGTVLDDTNELIKTVNKGVEGPKMKKFGFNVKIKNYKERKILYSCKSRENAYHRLIDILGLLITEHMSSKTVNFETFINDFRIFLVDPQIPRLTIAFMKIKYLYALPIANGFKNLHEMMVGSVFMRNFNVESGEMTRGLFKEIVNKNVKYCGKALEIIFSTPVNCFNNLRIFIIKVRTKYRKKTIRYLHKFASCMLTSCSIRNLELPPIILDHQIFYNTLSLHLLRIGENINIFKNFIEYQHLYWILSNEIYIRRVSSIHVSPSSGGTAEKLIINTKSVSMLYFAIFIYFCYLEFSSDKKIINYDEHDLIDTRYSITFPLITGDNNITKKLLSTKHRLKMCYDYKVDSLLRMALEFTSYMDSLEDVHEISSNLRNLIILEFKGEGLDINSIKFHFGKYLVFYVD